MKKKLKRSTFYGICLIMLCTSEIFIAQNNVQRKRGNLTWISNRDLDDIVKQDTLKVLVDKNTSSLFIDNGRIHGFEYDIFKLYAAELGVHLDIQISQNLKKRLDLLNNGDIDVIAMGLTGVITDTTKVLISDPYMYDKEVLIQNKPLDWESMSIEELDEYLVKDLSHLLGKDVAMRQHSHQMQVFKNMVSDFPEPKRPNIIGDNGDLNAEDFVRMVNNGAIDYTILNGNQAKLIAPNYPNIDANYVLSNEEPVTFTFRKTSKHLQASMNAWLSKMKGSLTWNIIYNRYFKNSKSMKSKHFDEFCSINGKFISPYDAYIKEQAKRLNWDWRLLVAMIYQESMFDPKAESYAGARGLMQLITPTAVRFNLEDPLNPLDNIKAGVSYIKSLEKIWEEKVPDPEERIKFILASYNVGPGHILDAVRLTKHFGGDHQKWHDNVEKYLEKLDQPQFYKHELVRHGYCRSKEPVKYVRSITERWFYYQDVEHKKEDAFYDVDDLVYVSYDINDSFYQ